MDSLEMMHRDSTLGETSRELNGTNPILYTPEYSIPFTPMEHGETVFEENPILHYPYRSDSVKVQYTIRNGSSNIPPSSCEKIMAVGYPSFVKENIFEGHGFVGEFNPKYGISNWVSECLTQKQMKSKGDTIAKKYRNNLFYEDKEGYFERIATLDVYHIARERAKEQKKRAKEQKERARELARVHLVEPEKLDREHSVEIEELDRGHLAAAGYHRYNSVAYTNTFCLKNIAPMYHGVNQILGDIEKQGRKFKETDIELYIITGPVFYPEREPVFIIEGSKLRVPDAFFKVFALKDTNGKYKVSGYLVNNYPITHEETHKVLKNRDNARTSLELINEVTGLNILGNVKDRIVDDLFKDQRTPSNRDNRTG